MQGASARLQSRNTAWSVRYQQYQGQHLWTCLGHPAAFSVHLEVLAKAVGLAVLPESSAVASPTNTITSSLVEAAQTQTLESLSKARTQATTQCGDQHVPCF